MTSIPPEDRTLAALTHLSGLAGYLIPLGGVIVPIIIWIVKSDSPIISTIAKQALVLNVAIFICTGAAFLLFLTVILIPVVFVLWALLGLIAVALPIIGALKAWDGVFYSYPVVGLSV